MVGDTMTLGTILKGCSTGKVENHCDLHTVLTKANKYHTLAHKSELHECLSLQVILPWGFSYTYEKRLTQATIVKDYILKEGWEAQKVIIKAD